MNFGNLRSTTYSVHHRTLQFHKGYCRFPCRHLGKFSIEWSQYPSLHQGIKAFLDYITCCRYYRFNSILPQFGIPATFRTFVLISVYYTLLFAPQVVEVLCFQLIVGKNFSTWMIFYYNWKSENPSTLTLQGFFWCGRTDLNHVLSKPPQFWRSTNWTYNPPCLRFLTVQRYIIFHPKDSLFFGKRYSLFPDCAEGKGSRVSLWRFSESWQSWICFNWEMTSTDIFLDPEWAAAQI